MSRLVPLAMVLLVLTAGCIETSNAPDAAGTTETTESLTTTETTRATTATGPTPAPNGTLAPGVTGDGIENVSALLGAHAAALRERGFELAVDRRLSADGETRDVDRRTVAAAHLRRVRSRTTSTLAGNRTVRRAWFNETMERMLVRVDARGEVRYHLPTVGSAGSEGRARYVRRFVETRQVADLLRGGEFNVTAVNGSGGDARYTLVGTNFSTDGYYGEREVHVTVSADGVVRVLKATGDTSDGGSFAFGYRVERLGVESVERPDWVAAAPAPIDARPTAGFRNCTSPYLTLHNEGPDTVPAGAVVAVRLNGTEHRATVDSALAPDDRVALYLDADGGLRVADAGDAPADRTPMPKEAEVEVRSDGMILSDGAIGFGCATESEGESESGAAGTSG